MLSELLARPEGKTLEFKANAQSPLNIIKTLIAFANTAGGTLVIGVEDKTRQIIGVEHILQEEERLANIIADSIEPMLFPEVDIVSQGKHEVLVLQVPYLPGPYYYKQAGLAKGTFIRLGSTNRLADNETLAALLRAAKHQSFDETPCPKTSLQDLDEPFMTKVLQPIYSTFDPMHYESLGLMNQKQVPTYGALLLFARNRLPFLPDSSIHCVCYAGISREKIIDQKAITSNLITAVDEVIAFIERHTNVAARIGRIAREDIAQFPPLAIREAVVNALVHADYALAGTSIQIAVFADRVEITNPGALTFGQTLASALAGISKLRNRVVGRIFRELKLIERLGSGIPRILAAYVGKVAHTPQFEEINTHFRVTLFELTEAVQPEANWEHALIQHLTYHPSLATKNIAEFWQVTERAARARLKGMLAKGLIKRMAKSKTDPTAKYALAKI